MTKKIFIYGLLDGVGVIRYVGQTSNVQRRLRKHVLGARARKSHRDRWIMKLLERGFYPKIVVLETVEANEWANAERRWIRYGLEHGWPLTNETLGGEGVDAPRTKEWRQKISKALKGKPLSEETKKKLSKAHKGRKKGPMSDATKRKLSKILKGRHRSEAVRKKMSESHKKYWQRVRELRDS